MDEINETEETTSPFHEGESRVQARLGVREEIEPWARQVVRPFLPEQHRAFYADLPFLVIAARDGAGRPWATLLAGEPGFVRSPEPDTLSIGALPAAGDPLAEALARNDDVGVLGIDLQTRRRNRVNGRVTRRGEDGFDLRVEQAFGNCPQYIHERSWRREAHGVAPVARRHSHFSDALRAVVERADTFFIATGYRGEGESPVFGTDASHRGGAPGFVRLRGDRTLLFPDYAGNNHFNTLGNLVQDSRAGLLFVDFESGDTLQLTGRAFVHWDGEHPEQTSFPGARRVIRFELDEAVELRGALPLRWETEGESVRELRVVAKVRESDDVASFVFAARDGSALAGFHAGQHLPIDLELAGRAVPVSRTYSLSGSPGGDSYRITVKRESHGLASRLLHDQVEVGHILSARAPRGEFVLDRESTRPVVLASAGVGLTPLVSMLHELAAGDGRPVWFVHGARDGRHHPLADEVRAIARSAPHVKTHFAYSRPRPEDELGRDYDSAGRIDAALLGKLVPGLEADWYLCGPVGFLASTRQGLEDAGVPAERIRHETFGPTGGTS